ncbi:hypothetical protein NXS11_05615 [Staphylococcus sp. GRT3]|uniref:Uncharacterized protein n=1 Tax=Staphylococcus americanisciuri TaxID=2973940 RepID=A0ABT2F3H4_9STAP|nr:hypothetical protein [Staphylococcus americanisciuri]
MILLVATLVIGSLTDNEHFAVTMLILFAYTEIFNLKRELERNKRVGIKAHRKINRLIDTLKRGDKYV